MDAPDGTYYRNEPVVQNRERHAAPSTQLLNDWYPFLGPHWLRWHRVSRPMEHCTYRGLWVESGCFCFGCFGNLQLLQVFGEAMHFCFLKEAWKSKLQLCSIFVLSLRMSGLSYLWDSTLITGVHDQNLHWMWRKWKICHNVDIFLLMCRGENEYVSRNIYTYIYTYEYIQIYICIYTYIYIYI